MTQAISHAKWETAGNNNASFWRAFSFNVHSIAVGCDYCARVCDWDDLRCHPIWHLPQSFFPRSVSHVSNRRLRWSNVFHLKIEISPKRQHQFDNFAKKCRQCDSTRPTSIQTNKLFFLLLLSADDLVRVAVTHKTMCRRERSVCFYHLTASFSPFVRLWGWKGFSPPLVRRAYTRCGDTLCLNCFLVQNSIRMDADYCSLLRRHRVSVCTLFLVSHNKCSWPTRLSFSSRSNTELEAHIRSASRCQRGVRIKKIK